MDLFCKTGSIWEFILIRKIIKSTNDDHDKTSVESMGKTEYKAIYLPDTKLLFDKNILLREHSRAIHIK